MVVPSPKVLVVDDNEANRLLAKSALEDEGYDVVVATSGQEGLDRFAVERPDCVLLDIRMPGLDGLQVCQRLRADRDGAETPILFLTALRDVDTFDQALAAGGDDFLTKPVRPTELAVRVRTALELRRTKAELREHYELLKRQRDDLLRLQLQKERLTAFVVHDLKNPVNTMDLHAQLLLREADLSESGRESATQIRREARQLTRMLMNLLDVSKADEGKLAAQPAPIDLPALAAELCTELDIVARARGVAIESAIAVDRLVADRDLLRRVLVNLAENSIRYAPAKSAVKIAACRVDAAIELTVEDSGPGIPPEMRERVFEPFVQVEGGERVVARTSRGLGLTFCRLAVEAHGGSIRVEDAAPGTRFCVRIPDAA